MSLVALQLIQMIHIVTLEKIQHWSTKFIISTSSLSRMTYFTAFAAITYVYFYEYLDVILLIHAASLQHPNDSFNIHKYHFLLSHYPISSFTKISLKHCSTNHSQHFYFNRVARLYEMLFLTLISFSLFLP